MFVCYFLISWEMIKSNELNPYMPKIAKSALHEGQSTIFSEFLMVRYIHFHLNLSGEAILNIFTPVYYKM